MTTTLKLNGNTFGTINLNDNNNYALLDGWKPKVAKTRVSQLGGRSVYMNVVESIPIRIFSKSIVPGIAIPEIYDKLQALVDMLHQAERWANGSNAGHITQTTSFSKTHYPPVILEYKPHGSDLTVDLQAMVLGSPGGANSLLGLPVTFNKYNQVFEIERVMIPILRRGAWIDDSETAVTSSSKNVPDKASASTADFTNIDSPFLCKIIFAAVPSANMTDAIILMTNDDNKLSIRDASTFTGGAAVVDANAFGGNIRRVTDSAGTTTLAFAWSTPESNEMNRCQVYAMLRNNSATKSWTIQSKITSLGADAAGRKFIIDTSTVSPRAVYIGSMATNNSPGGIEIDVSPSSTGGGGETIDFDSVVVIRDDDQAFVITINEAFLSPFSEGTSTLIIDPSVLTRQFPVVYSESQTTTDIAAASYGGDAYTMFRGQEIPIVVLAKGTGSTQWRYSAAAGSAFTFQVTKLKAYGAPT